MSFITSKFYFTLNFCKVITNMLIIWRIHSKKKKSLKIISQETTVTNSRKYLMNWPTLFSQHQIR